MPSFDNLDLTLQRDSCHTADFIKQIPQHLTNVSNYGENQFGEYVTGYLDNLKVSITDTRVKIYDSSICKYYLGDNFKTLSKGDTYRAIEKISDSLQLPFHLANVTRIDFAENLIMKHDEKVYYQYLGEAHHYNRLEQNNGLYYNNQIRQLLFYGKVHEQKVKKQPIPDLYRERNVLRFEIRFKRQIKKQLKQPQITAGLLSKENFYSKLVKRWEYEYQAIQKINSKLTTMKPTGSRKEFIENLALFTILELGQPNILNKVKEWQLSGEISKKQAYDIRTSIKQIASIQQSKASNELIDELNKKIKEAARNW